VIKHIYDTHYVPLGIVTRRVGEAGFCITGNSGGSSQVAYALSHSGLASIVDVVIPTGGPPHAALAKSCLDVPAESGYWYPVGTRDFIDKGFGHFDGNGPAVRQDPTFRPRWLTEGVATGGSEYLHPRTRVHFIFGDGDRGMQTVGGDYVERLRQGGTPYLTSELAARTGHEVYATAEGRATLWNAILQNTAAGYVAFGAGCAGGSGTPALAAAPATPHPLLGQTFVLEVTWLPPGAPVAVILGLSRDRWGPLPLPIDLAPHGAPGCALAVSADLMHVLPSTNGKAAWSLPIPNLPELLAASFYNQALVHDPGANTLGLTVTNAGEGTIGLR
jgi:hypothetical protein